MAETSAAYHEPFELLSETTHEHHRAIVSLMEELEAIDWYQQRIDAAVDGDLRAILEHNRDEEKEHAAMALEWLRRRDEAFDAELRKYLFTDAPIVEVDAGPPPDGLARDGSLGIGDLR